MAAHETSLPGTSRERRKAATRARILDAAERLFGARGYAGTSVEDISEAAGVAMRTVYTHFPSKAAIMLAAFDGWVDGFVDAVLQRPIDEPVADTVREALRAVEAAGWSGASGASGFADGSEDADAPVRPLVEHLHSGAPDVAGHVLQRWMREMDRIARDAIERGDYGPDSLEPRARAVAVFAAWIAELSAAGGREHGRGISAGATGQGVGIEVLALMSSGKL